MTTARKRMLDWLIPRKPCLDGLEWAKDNCDSLESLWTTAPHEYLRWLAERTLEGPHRLRIAVACARRFSDGLPPVCDAALAAAEAYAAGDIGDVEFREAAEEMERHMGAPFGSRDIFSAESAAYGAVRWAACGPETYRANDIWFTVSINHAVRCAGYRAKAAKAKEMAGDIARRSQLVWQFEREAMVAATALEQQWQVAHIRASATPNWALTRGL